MIIFLYGEDTYRSFQKVKELKDRFLKEVDSIGSGMSILNGEETTIQEISQNNNTPSLFSKKRMIVIHDVFLNHNIHEDLLKYLEKSKAHDRGDNNILIFRDSSLKSNNRGNILQPDSNGYDRPLRVKALKLFKFLSTEKLYTEELQLLSNFELVKWIENKVKKLDGKITKQAVQALISLVGNDLWTLSQEVEKLFYYKLDPKGSDSSRESSKFLDCKLSNENKTIEEEDVLKNVEGIFNQKMFELLDIVFSKNSRLAVKFLEEQYESGLNENLIFHMITKQVKTLLQIKQGLENGKNNLEIASFMKVHPFVIQKGAAQASKFDLEQLKEAFSDLLKINLKTKDGKGEIKTMIDLFVLKIGRR